MLISSDLGTFPHGVESKLSSYLFHENLRLVSIRFEQCFLMGLENVERR